MHARARTHTYKRNTCSKKLGRLASGLDCHSLAVWAWACLFTSLHLLLICEGLEGNAISSLDSWTSERAWETPPHRPVWTPPSQEQRTQEHRHTQTHTCACVHCHLGHSVGETKSILCSGGNKPLYTNNHSTKLKVLKAGEQRKCWGSSGERFLLLGGG